MTKKLFVGNLAYATTDDQLTQIFSAYGKVVSVNIIKDRFSQRSKGFGFVEFETEEEAMAAMQALDGSEQDGRNMVVKEATPRADDDRGETPAATAPVMEVPESPVAEDSLADAVSPTAEAIVPEVPVAEDLVKAPIAEEAPVTEEATTEEVDAPVKVDEVLEEADETESEE